MREKERQTTMMRIREAASLVVSIQVAVYE
jgi:hypothetical protein